MANYDMYQRRIIEEDKMNKQEWIPGNPHLEDLVRAIKDNKEEKAVSDSISSAIWQEGGKAYVEIKSVKWYKIWEIWCSLSILLALMLLGLCIGRLLV